MKDLKYIPGDLVIDNYRPEHNPRKIVTITNTVKENSYQVTDKDRSYIRNGDDLEPLPITKTLLIDNGWWQAESSLISPGAFTHHVSLMYEKRVFAVYVNNWDINFNIVYIHELQHILFALGLDHSLIVRDNKKELKTMNDYLELLPNLNEENREIFVDNSNYSYSPNLYKYDGSWVLDWINSDYEDSLHAETGKSPLQAVKRAYHWCLTHGFINTECTYF